VLSRSKERGAVAVEMAVIVPVLALMAFGMLELGLAFVNKLDMSQAVNQATRQATVMGTDESADIEILTALDAGLSGDLGAIQQVLIFRASPDGTPLVWDAYSPGGSCGWTPCPDPVPGPAVYGDPDDYKPCDRDVSLGDGVDTIGVQVRYTHSWITGVLGLPAQTWHETARARLEPQSISTAVSTCP
jgi:hypothetical protein